MKKSVVSLVLAAVSIPAAPAEQPLERLIGCADIRDTRERLSCFDREVAPLVSSRPRAAATAPPVPPPLPAPRAASPPPVPPAPVERSFGEEQLQRKDRAPVPDEQQTLHAKIERIRGVTASDFIVYLDNGQAWRHQDLVQGAYLRVGDEITISKGALGSYRLARDAGSSKNWIRVTRFR